MITSTGLLSEVVLVDNRYHQFKRGLESSPQIDFTDDRDGCLFAATVHREESRGSEEIEVGSGENSQRIIDLMQRNSEITISELALSVGVTDRAIKKQIEKMKSPGNIQRVGPYKGGHWEVVK